MLDDLELSLMAFPQSWVAATHKLHVNLLVLPVGNPLDAVGSVAQFAGTTLRLTAELITGESLPASTMTPAFTAPFAAVPPIGARALLNSMITRLPAGTTITTGKVTAATAPPASVRVMKSLPPSYTQAFPFSRSRNPALFVTGDGYACAVAAQNPGTTPPNSGPPPPPPPKTIAWGQILSYILRQPKLARACGLVYSATLTIPPALLTDTSWIGFAIDRSNPANPFASDVAGQSRHGPHLRRTAAGADRQPQALCRNLVPGGADSRRRSRRAGPGGGDLRRRLCPNRPLPPAADHRYGHRKHGRHPAGRRSRHSARLGRRAGHDLARPPSGLAARPGKQHRD